MVANRVWTQSTDIAYMTPQRWAEDIEFLSKKIDKQFQTFKPELKTTFARNLSDLKSHINAYSNVEMVLKLSQLIAELNDGHTEIQFTESKIGLKRLPLSLYFFEEGLYIVGTHEEYKSLIGSKINTIGGKLVSEIIKLLDGFQARDNIYEIYHAGPGYIVMPAVLQFLGISDSDERATLNVTSSDGNTNEVTIESKSFLDYYNGKWFRYRTEFHVPVTLAQTDSTRDNWFKYMEKEKTMYFFFGSVNDQDGYAKLKKVIDDLFDLVDQVKPDKLVIDVRRNRGGNYYTSRPLIDAINKRPWLNEKGKIYALCGRTTFSAALVTCIFLKTETNAILVGEPPRGAPNKTDNVEHLRLPNSGLRLEYTTRIKKHWPELGDVGMIPIDIEVPVRFSDYTKGVDAAMEAILK